MRFIKENWFKIVLSIAIFCFIVLQYYNTYIAIKRHHLDIITEVRGCISTFKDYDTDDAFKKCRDLSYDQRVKLFNHLISW